MSPTTTMKRRRTLFVPPAKPLPASLTMRFQAPPEPQPTQEAPQAQATPTTESLEATEARKQAAGALLVRLASEHPLAFGAPVPLAVGMLGQVREATGASWAVAKEAMRRWCGQPAYLAGIAAGGTRINLDGTQAGQIEPDHQRLAAKKPAVRGNNGDF